MNNKQRSRLCKYLTFIFVMACTRTILMNFNDLDNQEARVTSDLHTKLISRKSFIAGYLIFGNLADNAFDPKLLLVSCLSVSGAM